MLLKARRIAVLFFILTFQTTIALLTGGFIMAGQSISDDRILPGVSTSGVVLGGMTQEHAESVLRERFKGIQEKDLILEAEDGKWIISMKEIGAEYNYSEAARAAFAVGRSGSAINRIWDQIRRGKESINITLFFEFDQHILKKEMDRISGEYTRTPRNARLVLEKGQVRLISSVAGREMDVEKTMVKIIGLADGSNLRINIETRVLLPQISDEDISGLTDLLGECTTRFSPGSDGRVKNITNAALQVNGTLIKPGEMFSFNDLVSPVDESNGYYKAPVIIGDQLVDDLGGGICQVTTTLYGAVLLSGLEIAERHPHSKLVKYVPPGLDAAVAVGFMDFKFRNNLLHPVYIIASPEEGNGTIKISMIGVKEDRRVYVFDTEETVITPGIIIKSSSRLKHGQTAVIHQGSPGYDVMVYRVFVDEYQDEVREQVSRDYYPPEPKVIEVGLE